MDKAEIRADERSWPEQDAIEDWWRKNRFELMEAASKYRLKIQQENKQDPKADLAKAGVMDKVAIKAMTVKIVTEIEDMSNDYFAAKSMDYNAPIAYPVKRLGRDIEAALTAAQAAGVSQAHRIEIFPDGGDVYVHHEKCGGACDYSCDGGGFLPYPEAVDFLVKENE